MAYTLVEIKAITSDEAKRILQGLGKRIEEKDFPKVEEPKAEKIIEKEKVIENIPLEIQKQEEKNDLETPTIFRQNINKVSK
jgi:hypothetical protein